MDIKEFVKDNNLNYRIFSYDREKNKKGWEIFEREFSSFLGINHYTDNLSHDYFLYGGVVILNHKKDKIIMVPTNWNKTSFDYLKEQLKNTPELKELKFSK